MPPRQPILEYLGLSLQLLFGGPFDTFSYFSIIACYLLLLSCINLALTFSKPHASAFGFMTGITYLKQRTLANILPGLSSGSQIPSSYQQASPRIYSQKRKGTYSSHLLTPMTIF